MVQHVMVLIFYFDDSLALVTVLIHECGVLDAVAKPVMPVMPVSVYG